jgi:hypothetical protein
LLRRKVAARSESGFRAIECGVIVKSVAGPRMQRGSRQNIASD